jgi:hypothetical protein
VECPRRDGDIEKSAYLNSLGVTGLCRFPLDFPGGRKTPRQFMEAAGVPRAARLESFLDQYRDDEP